MSKFVILIALTMAPLTASAHSPGEPEPVSLQYSTTVGVSAAALAAASSSSSSSSSATSVTGSSATSGGNSQSVNVDAKARPAASAPGFGLTSVGTDNCLGSISASAGTGFWSFGAGATKESIECNRRAYARALRELGQHEAALALLCLNEEVASVSPTCPTKKEEQQMAP